MAESKWLWDTPSQKFKPPAPTGPPAASPDLAGAAAPGSPPGSFVLSQPAVCEAGAAKAEWAQDALLKVG